MHLYKLASMLSLNHIPLLRLIIPFILGIIGVVYLQPELYTLLFGFSSTLLLYLILLLVKRLNMNYKLRWLFGVLLYTNFLLAGATLTSLKYLTVNSPTHTLAKNSDALILGEISEIPQIKEKTIKVIIELKGIRHNKNWIENEGKVILYMQKDSSSVNLGVGDIISFEPKLENVPPPKNPNEFDFRKYLSYHLIHQQAFLRSNNWHLVEKESNINLILYAHQLRTHLISILKEKGLENEELAVASALILGYKDDIDAQLKNAYSSAGAMHVLAVSGLHVGIIFMIFSQLLLFLDRFKWGLILKTILIVIILWLYALITGLSPSVMRASTMFTFVALAKIFARNSSFFNTLAASAFTLLIYNPLLIMEVGFQLSYLAVMGIVIIQPWVNNWFTINNWLGRKIWEITAVSIAAQIATFPLGLLYFHQFPNYFFLSNLVVIPLALAILCLGITALALNFIPLIGDYLVLGLNYLVKALNFSVNYIDALPYSLTNNIKFSITDTWLVYIGIVCFILLIAYRQFKFLLSAAIAFICLFTLNLYFQSSAHYQKKFIVYNIPHYSAINFIDGTDNILVSDIKLTQNRSKMLFHTQNNWINTGVKNEKIVRLDHLIKKHQLSNIYRISNPNLFNKRNYFQFYNKRLVVIDNHFRYYKPKTKLDCDVIILTKNTQLTINQLSNMFNTTEFIIDASNSSYNRNRWKNELRQTNCSFWDITDNGAYQLDL